VAKEQTIDLVRFGPVQRIAAIHLVPFRQPRVEHAVHDDVGHSRVVWMYTGSRRREDKPRFVNADQARDRQTRFDRITNQAVVKRKRDSTDAKDGRRLLGLIMTHAWDGMARRFAVTEIDEEHTHPAAHEHRGCAAHHNFQVVGMRTEGHDVESLRIYSIHDRTLTREMHSAARW